MTSQKITPCIWTDSRIEEQAKFYASVFPNSKVKEAEFYGENGRGPKGAPLVVMMDINGVEFMLLNGGEAEWKPNEAISFLVHCGSQKEVDAYWDKLTSCGGAESMCGWLKDRYGVSWQIIPDVLLKLQTDKDRAKAGRVMQAMLKMRKIDIAALERAAAG